MWLCDSAIVWLCDCWWLNFSRFSHYLQDWFAVPVHDSLSPSHVGHFHITPYHPNMVRKIKTIISLVFSLFLKLSRFSHYLQGWFAVPVHDSLSPSHVGHFHITLYHPNMIDKDKNHYFFSHPQLELWAPTVWNCWWLNFSRFSHYLQSSTVGTVGAHSLKLLMTKFFNVFSLLTRLVCCPSAC